MTKGKVVSKIIAAFLVFTLTFSNFAFVSKSFATSIFDSFMSNSSDTGHENVEFDAYFGTDEKTYEVVSDVNNEELAITLDLNVMDSGYLKNAQITITAKDEGEKLNYKLKNEEEFAETEEVQSVEDDVISLKQVNNGSEVILSVPIEYQNEEYVNETKLSRDSKVVLTGTYVDDEGEETEISKEVDLNVYWEDEREVTTFSEVTKYIQFGLDGEKGVILQTSLNVDSSSEGNTLPVKYSNVSIEVPTVSGKQISSVQVIAVSTAGTNGKSDERVSFSEDNWNYDSETNTLTINVENEKELVEVSNAGENDNVIDGEAELEEEERYYSVSGVDSYLITYTYEDIEIAEEINTSSKVNVELATLSGIEGDEYINLATSEMTYEYNLTGETGDIVSYSINNETDSVSKAYTYVNYNSSAYEVNYESKTTINVSYTEIVEQIVVSDTENYYISNSGDIYSADDIYYKQVSINKENFDSILSEDGYVNIKDTEGNVIAVVNKDVETDENGDYVITFDGSYTKLTFETSAPTGEGNLIISNVKGSRNSMYSKDEYKEFNSVVFKTSGSAKYTYVDDMVNLGQTEIATSLTNTTTKATITMDRDNLSTLAENDNVELRIELNNDKASSDVYGYSVFNIEFPSYITDITITDASIMYGEGLDIVNVEGYVNEDGTKIIAVTVDGTQTALSSGSLNNGTNIVLNANISVDLYTPATSDEIRLNYTNSEATSYENEGTSTAEFYYSAPTGVVAVNSTTGYDDQGSVLTSVRQGKQEAELARGVDAKIATMEIIVMNNNSNIISDLSILGRIPFEGVTDLATGEDLGTTLDTTMVSGIVSDENNAASFIVYYSENGEATNDLDDSSNGWTTDVEDLSNVKSYLIVPTDENYEMQESEVLRFTYEYEIPGGLTLNESVYGTFMAYYTNHTDIATIDETAQADIIGLSTGEGPELSAKLTSSVGDTIKEFEEMTYTVTVQNSGKTSAENVVVTLPLSSGMSIQETTADDGIQINTLDTSIEYVIPSLGVNESAEMTLTISASIVSDNEFSTTATVTADNAEEAITTETLVTAIEETVMTVSMEHNFVGSTVEEGREVEYSIVVRNLTKDSLENVVVKMQLPDEFAYSSGYTVEPSDEFYSNYNTSTVSYDDSTRTVTVNVGTLTKLNSAQVVINVTVKELESGVTYSEVSAVSTATADGCDEVTSNDTVLKVGKPSLTISQTTNTTNTYVQEGDTIEYVFTITNNGNYDARNVCLTDYVPDGLLAKYITYEVDGITSTKSVSGDSAPTVTATVNVGSTMTVTVQALAKSLDGVQEATVTNSGTVQSETMTEAITSNEITHIIESNGSSSTTEEAVENTGATGSTSSSSSNITKTYKISGVAWVDEDGNGMRDSNETLLTGVTARLVNAETGVIEKSVTTDSKGAYTLSGVANGSYLIVFDYDTVTYTVTTYQKAGVESNVNSDAITTKIEQDGKQRNAAITDTITVADSSLSNVDIGFVYADTFDLKLESGITKITVQNNSGTTSTTYDYETLAKTEIGAKYLSSSTVYIEYTIRVSNEGEISGYAKKLVDYLPDGMTFSSTLNPDWYTGTDGNLYTTALADTEIAPGETKELTLVLTKQMTEDNTGLVNNQTEIYEDYNIYGVSDTNSTPANQTQGENDLGAADAIIGVKTGEVFIYTSVILTSVILGAVVIFIAYNQIVIKKRKAGV